MRNVARRPLTHLFEGLVSEQVLPGQSERAQRQKKLKTHAKISTSSRKGCGYRAKKNIYAHYKLRLWSPLWEKQQSCAVQVIRSSWNLHSNISVLQRWKRFLPCYDLFFWLHRHLSWHAKTRAWKMSDVTNPTEAKGKQKAYFLKERPTTGFKKRWGGPWHV